MVIILDIHSNHFNTISLLETMLFRSLLSRSARDLELAVKAVPRRHPRGG